MTTLAVFTALFLIYLATLLRTVVDQDSGELVSACHVLGIAHPTGYPLWVLLGRLFDLLPLGGTSAYRVGLLSAVSAAAAAALVTLVVIWLLGETIPALAGGIAFGLWYPTWSQAVRAEVYGLAGLLFALALVALLRWERKPSWAAALCVAVAAGLVAMHHRTTMLAVAPSLIAAVALTRPRRFRMYLAAALCFLAPFACYAYLPIRALARPPVNWTNPSTWDRFWEHVLATQYKGYALSHDLAGMAESAAKLLPEVLAPSIGWSLLLVLVACPLAAWGAVWWTRRHLAVAASVLLGACGLIFWVLQWGETADLKVFLLPAGAVLAVCWGAGLTRLGRMVQWPAPRAGMVVAAGVLLCGPLAVVNWERSDLSDLWQHRDRWLAMLDQLEPNAVFISDNDVPSFATMYLQNVEGIRRDVTLLRVVPMRAKWYVDLIEDPQVREAAAQAWADVPAELREVGPHHTPEMAWERTAQLAYHLEERLGGSRPVYVLHGRYPLPTADSLRIRAAWPLAEPPHFVGLSYDVVALQSSLPEVTREKAPGPALVEFPGGVELVGFVWDRPEAESGEVVGFRAEWRLRAEMPVPLEFGVRLVPQSVPEGEFERRLSRDGHFLQAFPLVHSLGGIAASPEGTVYEQKGAFIVPTNTPPGRCRVEIGVNLLYEGLGRVPGASWLGWTRVGTMQVRARPRPRNGP